MPESEPKPVCLSARLIAIAEFAFDRAKQPNTPADSVAYLCQVAADSYGTVGAMIVSEAEAPDDEAWKG